MATFLTAHEKRKRTAKLDSTGGTFHSSHFCEDTKVETIIHQSRNGLVGYAFDARSTSTFFLKTSLESAHEILSFFAKAQQIILDRKRNKTAPHTLQVGDVLCKISGYSNRNVSFFQVVDIPHPRDVTVQSLSTRYVHGDWVAGHVVPNMEKGLGGDKIVHRMNMQSGEPLCNITDGSYLQKWSGKPETVYCT